jgi:hypothetical protein
VRCTLTKISLEVKIGRELSAGDGWAQGSGPVESAYASGAPSPTPSLSKWSEGDAVQQRDFVDDMENREEGNEE